MSSSILKKLIHLTIFRSLHRMFWHECSEPIALLCPHACNRLIALCSTKQNLTIFDIVKDISIRQFSVGVWEIANQVSKQTPIGLFFVDNISCRAIQVGLKCSVADLPSEDYLCLVFPRGVVLWDNTITRCEYKPFPFTATCVAQAPGALILGDGNNGLHVFQLKTYEANQIANTQGTPSFLFVSQCGGDYGIVVLSSSGMIEFFTSTGKLACQCSGDVSKTVAFDLFSGTLFVLKDKKVRLYRVTPTGITREGECGFSGVTVGDSKPTTYSVQSICPCHLPITTRPLFFAICDQNSLLIGGSTRVVQKVSNYGIKETKKMNVTMMCAHPTDLSLIIMCSGQDMVIVDVFAHLPQIVPSVGIPNFVKDTEASEGVFNVKMNDELIIVINRSSETYTVYDRKSKQRIVTRNAFDVVLGPRRRYADLKYVQGAGKKKDARPNQLTAEIYEDDKSVKRVPVIPRSSKESIIPMRMASIGEYFAVIVGNIKLALSFNTEKQGMTKSYVYKWETFEPIALQFDGAAMLDFEAPYVAIASPNGYAVYDTENNMKEIVRRQRRLFHFKLHQGKLYFLTYDGLEVDNLQHVELLASRFSHLMKQSISQLLPINSLMIKEIQDNTITTVDSMGNASSIITSEREGNVDSLPILARLAKSQDPIEAASKEYQKNPSKREIKRMILMMMSNFDWPQIEAVLCESERAAFEQVTNDGQHDYLDEFNVFVRQQLEVEPDS